MRLALYIAASAALAATPATADVPGLEAAPDSAIVASPAPSVAIEQPRPSGDLALSAGAGMLGNDPIYSLRLAYFALPWLGAEANLAHNPSGSEHAVLHYANAIARLDRGLGRVRPFATAGLGTIEVFPGTALNAKPVTKLLLDAGAGAHLQLFPDVALRVEARSFTVLDEQEARRGAYSYLEWSGGVTFSRALRTPVSSETGAEP